MSPSGHYGPRCALGIAGGNPRRPIKFDATSTTHADGMATMSCQLRHGPLRLLTRAVNSLTFSALEACSLPSHFVSHATTCHFSLASSTGM